MKIWIVPIFILSIIILTRTADAESENNSVSNSLQTKQYLIVTQQDQQRVLEANLSSKKCPKVVFNEERQYINLDHIGMHLVRDIRGDLFPKILTVTAIENHIAIEVADFNTSAIDFNNENEILVRKHESRSDSPMSGRSIIRFWATWIFDRRQKSIVKNLVHSVFDTSTHMLYLSYMNATHFEVDQVLISGLFDDTALDHFPVKTHIGPFLRRKYDFVEDPYTGMFYYKEDDENQTLIFEAPIRDYVKVIRGTISGKQVNINTKYEKLFGVSKGTFYGLALTGKNRRNFAFTTSENPDLGLTCKITSVLPSDYKFIIVRNRDYCMLRDQELYNKATCDDEQNNYAQAGNADDTANEINVLLWLFIFCALLIVIIVLLCVYVHWLRTVVVFDERNGQNEYESEASVFIAKQRSFPASYQDPSLLDISVDRWN